jgi:hypothetical protein
MFVLPKPDPWVMDMELIFFFGKNCLFAPT